MSQEQVPPQGAPPPPPGWRSRTDAEGAGFVVGTVGPKKKMVGMLALLLALVGALVALVFFLGDVKPADVLILAIREYKSSLLPPNALAYQDGYLLEKSFGDGNVKWLYNVQDGEGIAREFKKLRDNSSRPQIVYLSALARVHQDRVYVLGGYANLDQIDSSWVPLADILQWLGDCPAPHKLLLLDLTRTESDARFGLGAEDIAARVSREIDALAPEKKILVLSACSPNQTSQISEELGHSLFAYYLDQGLRGHADSNQDHRITVFELAEYLKTHVDVCAWGTREVRQIPTLVAGGSDFTLVRNHEPAPAPDPPKEDRYPDWLAKGWKLRTQWATEVGKLGPGILWETDGHLVRAEQLWRGGFDEKARVENELSTALNRLGPLVLRVKTSNVPPLPCSLPLATTHNSFATSMQSLFFRADEKEKAKIEELDKDVQKLLKDHAKAAPAELAQSLCKAADDIPNLGAAQVQLMAKIVKQLGLKEPYVQIIFLERLEAFEELARKKGWLWPRVEAQQALRTMLQAERVLHEIALDPGVLSSVGAEVEKADDLRRSGERKLFSEGRLEWPEARTKLLLAQERYGEILNRVRLLRQARTINDLALDFLPRVVPTLVVQPTQTDAEALAWKEAVLAANKLTTVLAVTDSSGANDNQLKDRSTELQGHVDDLKTPFEGKVKRCLALGVGGEGRDYQEIQALLESSYVQGQQREKLWKAGQDLALRLLKSVAADPAENGQGPDLSAEQFQLRKRLRLQKIMDVALLSVCADGAWLLDDRDRVLKANTETIERLAGSLHKKWPQALFQDYKKDERYLMFKADRLARIVSPFDWASQKSTKQGNWSQNPTLAIYRKELFEFWVWLDKRYRAEGDAQDMDGPFRGAYRKIENEYERLAATIQ
jgi:hypothetical protein